MSQADDQKSDEQRSVRQQKHAQDTTNNTDGRTDKCVSLNYLIGSMHLRSLADGHLEDGAHLGVHGEAFSHAHAEGGVDPEGVVFDTDVVLQGGLGLHQAGQAQLRGLETLLQQSHRLADLRHLALQPASTNRKGGRFKRACVHTGG